MLGWQIDKIDAVKVGRSSVLRSRARLFVLRQRSRWHRLTVRSSVQNIPSRLIRTIPQVTTDEVEQWWKQACLLHPGWEYVTYREPVDPALFPLTSPVWPKCTTGAQKAGLIRLESVWRDGGIYLDSDIEVLRSFLPLTESKMFAAWEDKQSVPDAIFGAVAGHPALLDLLDYAIANVELGAWQCGPGAFSKILPGRLDVLLLPPGSCYPYHYTEQHRASENFAMTQPWAFCAHHWHGSWQSDAERAAIASRNIDSTTS